MPEYSNSFEIIARAVIVKDGKILVCRGKGKDYYFFPGGHVEKGERMEDALKRELSEELGIDAGKMIFIGAVENIFKDSYERHEINLVFETEVKGDKFESRESHLEFELLTFDQFGTAEVLPASMKEAVMEWMNDKQRFWQCQA
ncbi:MAG: NUDIX domain-containing protein [Minisyncoccia bacterium]